jgi:uncharacterized alpha/beta hydrolase family protein
MNKTFGSILIITTALMTAGCIHTEETVYKDVTRVPVEFESESAGRLFYETLSRLPRNKNRQESKTEVSIPVIFGHSQRVVRGENAAFNEAVAQTDTNKDGRITETEARIFSNQIK